MRRPALMAFVSPHTLLRKLIALPVERILLVHCPERKVGTIDFLTEYL